MQSRAVNDLVETTMGGCANGTLSCEGYSRVMLGAFVEAADPLRATVGANVHMCRICCDRPAFSRHTQLYVITDGGI